MRTRIELSGGDPCYVHLIADHPYGDGDPLAMIDRTFFIPRDGGYVRECVSAGRRTGHDWPQVCRGLERTGPTLICADPADFLALIRREWRAYRRARL